MVYICGNCGLVGAPVTTTRGSLVIEILLWVFTLIGGLIYSLWRRSGSTRIPSCAACSAPNMVPIDSPRGRQLVAAQGQR